MFEPISILFNLMNDNPLLLVAVLHSILILPMIWIYKQEKKRLDKE